MGDRTCSVPECSKPAKGRGWCGMHWWRWRNYGTTDSPRLAIEDRFATHVDSSAGPDSCHLWTGGRDKDGYGRFGIKRGETRPAARWLLGHLRGEPLKAGEVACHHCDNPACVNPGHLYVGDPHQNMQDKIDRGRASNGFGRWTRTHCTRGHEFDSANTYRCPRGKRQCRKCMRFREQRAKARAARG